MTAPAPAARPSRWMSTQVGRTMAGRLIAAIIVGLALATSMAADRRADRARGLALTRERYEQNYEAHRDSLLNANGKTAPAAAIVVIMVVFVALFEVTAWVLGRGVGLADDAMQRRAQLRRSRVLDDTDE